MLSRRGRAASCNGSVLAVVWCVRQGKKASRAEPGSGDRMKGRKDRKGGQEVRSKATPRGVPQAHKGVCILLPVS